MYESLALRHLVERGLRPLGRNVRAGGVEIDLIMRDPLGAVVFVEVRARRSARYGGAAASVCARKRARLRRGAAVWLMRWRGPVPPCRFDVLAFEQGRVVWLRDAFGLAD